MEVNERGSKPQIQINTNTTMLQVNLEQCSTSQSTNTVH
jgi:hypothetical protein